MLLCLIEPLTHFRLTTDITAFKQRFVKMTDVIHTRPENARNLMIEKSKR